MGSYEAGSEIVWGTDIADFCLERKRVSSRIVRSPVNQSTELHLEQGDSWLVARMALTGGYLSLRKGVTGDEKKIQTLLAESGRRGGMCFQVSRSFSRNC